LGSRAFCYDTSLKSVTLGSGLKTIPFRSFTECFELTKLDIPATITLMVGSSCEDNVKLRSFTIKGKNTKIDGNVIGMTHYPRVGVNGSSIALNLNSKASCIQYYEDENKYMDR